MAMFPNIGREVTQKSRTFNFQKGEIAVSKDKLYIFTNSKDIKYDYDKIGQAIDATNVNTAFSSARSFLIFYLEEEKEENEKNEKPKKTKKPGGWKTLKIIKSIKSLKRYRILKRLKKLNILKN